MSILQRTKRRKADWIGHILCRNCLLKHVEGKIEEKIEVAERRRRRLKQLLGDLKEKRGYFKLKEEALVTLSHSVENSYSKKLWICRKTDNRMNE
jgi:hypothetical protein